ncbi:hypothetical protein [Candidatus Harpocratesius sp.]
MIKSKKIILIISILFVIISIFPNSGKSTDNTLVWDDSFIEKGNYNISFQVNIEVITPSEVLMYEANQFQVNIKITPNEKVTWIETYEITLYFAPESSNLVATINSIKNPNEQVNFSENTTSADFSYTLITNNTLDFTRGTKYYFSCELDFGYSRIINGSENDGTNMIHSTKWLGPLSVNMNESNNPFNANFNDPILIDWPRFLIFLAIVTFCGTAFILIYKQNKKNINRKGFHRLKRKKNIKK